MQHKSRNLLKWAVGGCVLMSTVVGGFWSRAAIAQQDSVIVFPEAISDDSQPVMIIGGIEASDRVLDVAQRPSGNQRGFGRPRSERDLPPARQPGQPDSIPATPEDTPQAAPPLPPGLPGSPRQMGFPGPHGNPGPNGPFGPQRPIHSQSMAQAPVRVPADPDMLMQSPIFQKILSLMKENMELKAQMKIQSIQWESRIRESELENEVDKLRQQLEVSQVELKEARISKERLEKRISELEHRSRLLEERARSIGNQSSHKLDEDLLKRLATDMHRDFEVRVVRSDEIDSHDDGQNGDTGSKPRARLQIELDRKERGQKAEAAKAKDQVEINDDDDEDDEEEDEDEDAEVGEDEVEE